MKRTARYESVALNESKWEELNDLVRIFTAQKDVYLQELAGTQNWHWLDKPREFRAAMKSQQVVGVPVHLQDRARDDAVTTMKQLIEAAVEKSYLKSKIFTRFEVGVQRHYAFWLLKSYTRIGLVMQSKCPEPGFFLGSGQRRAVVRYLRRKLRENLGHAPRVKLHRSLALDSSLYRVFSHLGKQYLAVTGLNFGKRIMIPLRGRGRITGNLRLVLNPERKTIVVHMPYDLAKVAPAKGDLVGIDLGITEVLATSAGEKLGVGYGEALEEITEATNAKGKARNKLYQLAQKAEERDDFKKAQRIRKYNLGTKKLDNSQRRAEAYAKTLVGQAVRELFKANPAQVVVEDLAQLRGKRQSKKQSRVSSAWTRSVIRERLEFRCEAGGSSLVPVNAAYTSQMCPNPTCGFVNAKNRHGDRFHCLNCGQVGDADVIGAINVLSRKDDVEIRLHMPVNQVKIILDERYKRRKETSNGTPLSAGLQLVFAPNCQDNSLPTQKTAESEE